MLNNKPTSYIQYSLMFFLELDCFCFLSQVKYFLIFQLLTQKDVIFRCRVDRVQEFRRRVSLGGQVVSSCRCGLLRIEASDGPRY